MLPRNHRLRHRRPARAVDTSASLPTVCGSFPLSLRVRGDCAEAHELPPWVTRAMGKLPTYAEPGSFDQDAGYGQGESLCPRAERRGWPRNSKYSPRASRIPLNFMLSELLDGVTGACDAN